MSSRSLDLVREGVRHVLRHPTRSLLTALTSAIAIAVTVNVISLSFGFEEDITGTVTQFGRRTVDVSRLPVLVPGGTRPTLGPADAVRVRELVGDLGARVVPRRQVSAPVSAPGVESESYQVVGAGPDYLATMSIAVSVLKFGCRGRPMSDRKKTMSTAPYSAVMPVRSAVSGSAPASSRIAARS